MRSLAQQRQQWGLSQQALADLLGISRTSLAMAETGKRDLPVKILQVLAALQNSWQATTKNTATATPISAPKKAIQQKKAVLQYTLAQKQQQLAQYKTNNAALQRIWLQQLPEAGLPIAAKKLQLWIAVQKTVIDEKMPALPEWELALLEAEINCLNKQIILLEKYLS